MLLWITNQKHLLICGNLTPNDFNPMAKIIIFSIQFI
jgi:hypothetical protein